MSTTTAPADSRDLVERTAALVRAEGHPQAADALNRQAGATRQGPPSVLIAGEDKRGKSTLLNALIGEPDLSPVGVEVVTGAPISLHFAEEREAAIVRYGESTPIPTPFADARRLATVEGNPQNEANIRMVQLGLPHPLLRQLLLIDTPGVGGLSSGHGELTLQTLSAADALVFVLEAGAQLRAAELTFLRRASARIDTVILVLTKIDKFRGWRAILDDNLAILREQAPRFASSPVVPVSSVLALRALSEEDPEDAEMLREESGLEKLGELLSTYVVQRAADLHRVNVLRSLLPPLAQLDRALEERLSAAAPDGTARRALEAEQARLRDFNTGRADWQRRLDTGIRRITLQRQEDVNIGLVEIRRHYDDRLKEPSKADMESLPGELVADLTALAGRLNEASAQALTELTGQLMADTNITGSVQGSVDRLTADRVADQLSAVNLGDFTLNHYDKLNIVTSFASGRSIGSLVTGGGLGLTAGALVAPPIGIAIGLAIGGLYAFQAFRLKKRSLFSQEFRQWMTAQSTQTQTTVNTTFAREVIDLQEDIRSLIRDALLQREREITEALTEAKRLLEAETTQRTQQVEGLRKRRQAVRKLSVDVQNALAELRPQG